MGSGELIIPQDDARRGWFKLIVPAIDEVFGDWWGNDPHKLLPFIFAKMDPDQVAFDVELSQPMYALDKVALVQADKRKKGDTSKITPVTVVGLSAVSSEQEGHCYLSVGLVSCIIPIKPDHILVDTLITATTESQIVAPTTQETRKILDISGNPIDP